MGTGIQWADETWNVTTGCTKISPGCKHCYAERMSKRLQAMGVKKYAAGFSKVVCHPEALGIPLRWKKPRMVFVDSMSDLFHEHVPDEFIDKAFAVMALCPQHTFLVLTKRPKRMAEYITDRHQLWNGFHYFTGPSISTHDDVEKWCKAHGLSRVERERRMDIICEGGGFHFEAQSWPLSNVHLGTTVENQEMADKRIPHLLKTPAAVRFLSLEPLLEEIVLPRAHCTECDAWVPGDLPWGHPCVAKDARGKPFDACESYRDLGIDWVIIGCESGPNRRPCELDWVKSPIDQCDAAGVPVFVKQIPINDRVSKDPVEWPEWAKLRQYPASGNRSGRMTRCRE